MGGYRPYVIFLLAIFQFFDNVVRFFRRKLTTTLAKDVPFLIFSPRHTVRLFVKYMPCSGRSFSFHFPQKLPDVCPAPDATFQCPYRTVIYCNRLYTTQTCLPAVCLFPLLPRPCCDIQRGMEPGRSIPYTRGELPGRSAPSSADEVSRRHDVAAVASQFTGSSL